MNAPVLVDETFFRSRYRLLHLERVAYWRGKVGRADLAAMFDISGVQASADFQKYLEMNPGALVYDLRRKRYFWAAGARPILHVPDFDKAVEEFLVDDREESRLGKGGFLKLEYPRRVADAEVMLRVFRAVVNGTVLRVRYGSVNSGTVRERRMAPTGFGHDGFRRHVRAYCLEHGEYRDFVLTRFVKVLGEEEPAKGAAALPRDDAWFEVAAVKMRLNPKLPKETQDILREDFCLDKHGVLHWKVRRALLHYAKQYLCSLAHPAAGGKMVAWFVEEGAQG